MNSKLFKSSSVIGVEFSRYAAQQTGDQDLDDAARTLILKAVGISFGGSLAGHDVGLDAAIVFDFAPQFADVHAADNLRIVAQRQWSVINWWAVARLG